VLLTPKFAIEHDSEPNLTVSDSENPSPHLEFLKRTFSKTFPC
jgi:hypothetical protein